MEPDPGILLDPSRVLVGLGALLGLFAANEWRKVWKPSNSLGEPVNGPRNRDLQMAAFLTAGTLFLTCGGYLFGVFFGHIR